MRTRKRVKDKQVTNMTPPPWNKWNSLFGSFLILRVQTEGDHEAAPEAAAQQEAHGHPSPSLLLL